MRLVKASANQRVVEWARLVRECRNSELSCKAWCAQQGISERTYHYWQKRVFDLAILQKGVMVTEPSNTRFAELPPPQETSPSIAGTGVREAVAGIRIGEAIIEIYEGTEPETVKMLCQVLKSC